MSTTLAVLRQRTLESVGDYISVAVTTDIDANNSVISTNLKEYDGGTDDYFNGWYCYIVNQNNAGVERQISDYATATGTITVRGAALSNDGASTATIWVCRHSVLQSIDKALNRSLEELYPSVHNKIDDLTVITGNSLPDGSFEWWTSSTALKLYTTSNITLARTTSGNNYRGAMGTTSMKATATGADGYALLTSDNYPRLLDLMGRTVNFYCWAKPEVANDASIIIYTLQADGTAQTLSSTTATPAGNFSLIKLEDQVLNDDLVECQVRFQVATNTKYVYFDDAVLSGENLFEYLLPDAFQDGTVSQVYKQTESYSKDVAAYDLHPRKWMREGFKVIEGDAYKYLRLDRLPTNYRRLRLIGASPLGTLSAATDTISIDAGGRTDLIVAYAVYLMYEMEEAPLSSEDTSRYERESSKRYAKYIRLLRRHRMVPPAGTLRV